MAIAIDNSALFTANNAGANTLAYAMSAIANGIILVYATVGNITSVTYNGIALTFLLTSSGISIYYLQGPATGTNNLVINRSGGVGNSVESMITSFTGVLQSGTPLIGRQNNTSTATTSFSNNYTSSTSGSYILDILEIDGSPGSGVTAVVATGTGHVSSQYNYSGGGDQEGIGGGYTPALTPGIFPVGYSWTTVVSPATWNINYYELLAFIAPVNGFNIALV